MEERRPFAPAPIIEQAKSDSAGFSGREIDIPVLPQLLLPTLESLKAVGLESSQAVYFPSITLAKEDNYPGWNTRIGNNYYDWRQAGQIIGSAELYGMWTIVDDTHRPDYSVVEKWREQWEGIQNGTIQRPTYEPEPKDEIERIILEARWEKQIVIIDNYEENSIERVPYLPSTSRFGISNNEQVDIVFPKLAERIGLKDAIDNRAVVIRRPTLAEFNYLGNLERFSHFSQLGTSESVQDVFRGVAKPETDDSSNPRAIVSGSAKFGGVGQADYMLARDHTDGNSFRFVIVFN